MHINYFKPILAFLLIVAVAAGCNSKKAEKPSRLVSKAAAVATDAAKKLTETDHTDTLAMQNCILEAKAAQTEFQVAGDTAAINSFNRAYKQYLVKNDPDLAKEIFVERPKNLPDNEPWDEFEQLVEDPEPK